MKTTKLLFASLTAAFMLSACDGSLENSASSSAENKSGYLTASKSCDALYRNEVTAEGRKPDVDDYFILSRTPDGKSVKEACRFVDSEDGKDAPPAYEYYNLTLNSFCTGTTESRYPYSCYHNKGITEERDALRQRARQALQP